MCLDLLYFSFAQCSVLNRRWVHRAFSVRCRMIVFCCKQTPATSKPSSHPPPGVLTCDQHPLPTPHTHSPYPTILPPPPSPAPPPPRSPPPPPPPHSEHLFPAPARFSYATEWALFISAQMSTDAVSAVRKVWVLIRLWKQPSAQARA